MWSFEAGLLGCCYPKTLGFRRPTSVTSALRNYTRAVWGVWGNLVSHCISPSLRNRDLLEQMAV